MAVKTNRFEPCPELLDKRSPPGLKVSRMVPTEPWNRLVYPDRTSFLADGHSLLVNTKSGPRICDLDNEGELRPLPSEADGCDWLELAPDGRHVVFMRRDPDAEQIDLYRMDLEGQTAEHVFHGSGNVSGSTCPYSKLSVESISWDGRRVAGFCYLEYGQAADGKSGVVVVDTETGEASVIARMAGSLSHLRYYPGPEEPATRDLMVQHHQGSRLNDLGQRVPELGRPSDPGGVDLHVFRDDGSEWRDLPFGRDGVDLCIGHQVWRWPATEVAAIMLEAKDNSYGWADGSRQSVVTGEALPSKPDEPHIGGTGRSSERFLISQKLEDSRLCHLFVDRSGMRFAFDTFPVFDGERAGMAIYIASSQGLHEPLEFRYLLNSGVTFTGMKSHMHAHPILSHDGKYLCFNSDFYGDCQTYVVEGLPWPS